MHHFHDAARSYKSSDKERMLDTLLFRDRWWPPLGPLGRGVPGARLARGWRLGELVSSWFSAGCSALAWLAVGALGSWSPLGLFVSRPPWGMSDLKSCKFL